MVNFIIAQLRFIGASLAAAMIYLSNGLLNCLKLDPSCNKYCDLIGQEQVSYFPYKPVKRSYKPEKNCCLWVGLLLGSSL